MDVDIDFKTDFDPLDLFSQAVVASQIKNNKLTKHPAGAYFQHMPKDPVTELAAIPYKHAEDFGYFKIDFLHLSAIDEFNKYVDSKQELRELVELEPDWSLLQSESVVEQLFQIHRHHKLLVKLQPRSVLMLADAIALIRPAKREMVDRYVQCTTEGQRIELRKSIYSKPTDGAYYYKKPHAVAYAMTIVIQLHLIKATR